MFLLLLVAIESDEEEPTNSQTNNSTSQISKDIKPKSKSPDHKIPGNIKNNAVIAFLGDQNHLI